MFVKDDNANNNDNDNNSLKDKTNQNIVGVVAKKIDNDDND